MEKDLMNIKKDSLKSKLIDLFIIFITIVLGASIIFGSFYFSYSRKLQKAYESELNNSKVIEKDNTDSEEYIAENKEDTKNEETNEIISEKTDKNDNDSKNIEKNDEKRLPEWTDTAIQDIKDIYGSDEKQVYLTFDDGPSTEITPKILEILEEENVPATFFVLGKSTNAHPEIVKQEYEAGHFIANHGYTHTYSQIYASLDNVMDEYNRTNEAIRNAIGNPDYDCHLFRFPGGSSGGPYDSLKAQAKQLLADNQIASTNWNCLTSDAAGNTTVQAQYKGALETQGTKTSLIILMHDVGDKEATPETLKLLIKHYKEEGYEFKNFYDIFTNKNKEIEQESDLESNVN